MGFLQAREDTTPLCLDKHYKCFQVNVTTIQSLDPSVQIPTVSLASRKRILTPAIIKDKIHLILGPNASLDRMSPIQQKTLKHF